MKKLGAILLILGAFVVGGNATAGSDPKCTICHFPSHDPNNDGDVLVVGESGWTQSHWPHGDCMIGVATVNRDGVMVMGQTSDGETCVCEAMTSDPGPQ